MENEFSPCCTYGLITAIRNFYVVVISRKMEKDTLWYLFLSLKNVYVQLKKSKTLLQR
jgi:hypothetical protein